MWSKQGADLPRNWWRIRARVLRRSDICYVCGLPGADEVDHVIPRSEWNRSSSPHDESNLRPIHGRKSGKQCHARKTAAEGVRLKRQMREKRLRPAERHPGSLRSD
jgi:5-methylcytosine-specific restriction endonuclease McrA